MRLLPTLLITAYAWAALTTFTTLGQAIGPRCARHVGPGLVVVSAVWPLVPLFYLASSVYQVPPNEECVR